MFAVYGRSSRQMNEIFKHFARSDETSKEQINQQINHGSCVFHFFFFFFFILRDASTTFRINSHVHWAESVKLCPSPSRFPAERTLCIEKFLPMLENLIFSSTANSITGITLVEHTALSVCALFQNSTNAKFHRFEGISIYLCFLSMSEIKETRVYACRFNWMNITQMICHRAIFLERCYLSLDLGFLCACEKRRGTCTQKYMKYQEAERGNWIARIFVKMFVNKI